MYQNRGIIQGRAAIAFGEEGNLRPLPTAFGRGGPGGSGPRPSPQASFRNSLNLGEDSAGPDGKFGPPELRMLPESQIPPFSLVASLGPVGRASGPSRQGQDARLATGVQILEKPAAVTWESSRMSVTEESSAVPSSIGCLLSGKQGQSSRDNQDSRLPFSRPDALSGPCLRT